MPRWPPPRRRRLKPVAPQPKAATRTSGRAPAAGGPQPTSSRQETRACCGTTRASHVTHGPAADPGSHGLSGGRVAPQTPRPQRQGGPSTRPLRGCCGCSGCSGCSAAPPCCGQTGPSPAAGLPLAARAAWPPPTGPPPQFHRTATNRINCPDECNESRLKYAKRDSEHLQQLRSVLTSSASGPAPWTG